MSRPVRVRARRLVALLVLALALASLSGAGPSVAAPTCQLAGTWAQTTDQVGSTSWSISADGKAQESGIGNASGTATLSGGVLEITWETSNGYAGVYRWTLDTQCNGTGTLTFTRTAPGDDRQGKSYASTVDGPPPSEPTPTPPPSADCPQRATASAVNEVRVVAVAPGAEARKAGTPDDCWFTLTEGTVLQQGDEVSTDPDGAITLQFADTSTVVVRDTTQLKIASFFTEGGVVRTEILLTMGRVRNSVQTSEPSGNVNEIKSGAGHKGSVRGTVYDVEYDPGSKRTRFSVIEGTVEVTNGAKKVLVPAGREVVLTGAKTSKMARIGKAGLRGGISAFGALAKVRKLIARANQPCAIRLPRANASSVKEGSRNSWKVAFKILGARTGTARWTVKGTKTTASGALAKAIVRRCR